MLLRMPLKTSRKSTQACWSSFVYRPVNASLELGLLCMSLSFTKLPFLLFFRQSRVLSIVLTALRNIPAKRTHCILTQTALPSVLFLTVPALKSGGAVLPNCARTDTPLDDNKRPRPATTRGESYPSLLLSYYALIKNGSVVFASRLSECSFSSCGSRSYSSFASNPLGPG